MFCLPKTAWPPTSADELRKVGIPVIFNNPNVGKHLANHTIIAAVFSTNPADNPISRIVAMSFCEPRSW